MAIFLAPSPSKVKPFSFARPLRRQANCAVLSNAVKYESPKKFSSKLSVQFRCDKEKGIIGGRAFPIVMAAAAVPVPDGAKDSGFGKIPFSDVEVKRPRNVFSGRQWNSLDVATAAVLAAMHVLCLFAPFTFSWGAFWVAFWLYVITGLLGITLSFHRNLSHRSFKLPKWLEYFCAYCGVQALQGNPIDWVSTHRYHHQFCDTERDPHSPYEGFWFSHMNWLFDTNAIVEKCGRPANVGDLEKQPFYKFIEKTYIIHPILLAALLYAVGGFPYIVWGMGVRIVWVNHITWFVNSVCHVWGSQPWNTGDLSRNNWWVAILGFGEGWHNNHHAFEYSARHGLEWWQVDMTWYVVKAMEAVGLATDIKLPTEVHMQKLAYPQKS
ncbi:PREDICTED: palmitoyl-monogalactosyldiacylglycerol delta-7 desaturase, chloroplastic-like [Ipomoea nil]|uniref:palmitoyl-monogalactosyldiacylglycerol delta-7 desaturase, chloroplastic-like n=1 Tax=Ipomoea nil TaxID=35883 RepID=UPI0009015954|nr:PREDICTED: palmitoyl-monogalactosyldiacylglycerol delta-7 desaturase, chloroplastic-like [Ipomoea nil]